MKPKGILILIVVAVALFFGYTKFVKKSDTATTSEVSVSAKDTTVYGYKPYTTDNCAVDTCQSATDGVVVVAKKAVKPAAKKNYTTAEKSVKKVLPSQNKAEDKPVNQEINNTIPKNFQ